MIGMQVKKIIAHIFGYTLAKFINMPRVFNFKVICTDSWKPYTRYLLNNLHAVGKSFTQTIEKTTLI